MPLQLDELIVDRPMKSFYIGRRLAIAFGALITVLVSVGCLSLDQLGKIQTYVDEIVNRRWAKAVLSREALRNANQNDLIAFQIFLLSDRKKVDLLLAEQIENSKRITRALAQLALQIESVREQDLLNATLQK